MFLNITNTGTQIDNDLASYISINFANIGFNQIYIASTTLDKYKEVDITYPDFDNKLSNTICINEEQLNQNIIDWLNTL